MLKKIIIFVDEGFCWEDELARAFGIGKEELEPELDELCKKGYLKVVETNAKGMCAAGPNMRDDVGVGRKFALTEKGKGFISRRL